MVPKKKNEGGDHHRVLVMSQGSSVPGGQNMSMTWSQQSTLALSSQVAKSSGLQSTVRLATAVTNPGVVAVTTRWAPIPSVLIYLTFTSFYQMQLVPNFLDLFDSYLNV